MHDEEFERQVLRFEHAWRQTSAPELADFLEAPFKANGPDRSRLLIELICIDLEHRWRGKRSSTAATLSDYVERFPELTALGRTPLELIAEEYRVRSRWGDRPSHSEFLSRYREWQEPLRAELAQIDEELVEEASDPPRQFPTRISPALEPARIAPTMPLLSHTAFLLRRLIGAGRMGKVYEARPHGASHSVAVKFLRKPLLQDPRVVRRFLGEATTIARLRHPHIVGTQGLGHTPGGSYFIVMDYVAGPNLAQAGGRGEVAVDVVVRWVMETCEALAHAHAIGIVHCDLKPANLLLDDLGKIKVTDFGLARTLGEETPCAAEVEGTAPFMAPEQVSRSWGPIDQRTDVYGLGAVLFTLLTGRPPILGRRLPDLLAQVVAGSPIVPVADLRPELPKPLSVLCDRCLAKPPAARYQTIEDLHADLANLIL